MQERYLRILFDVAWFGGIACVAGLFILLSIAMQGQGAMLVEGNATGQGSHIMTLEGICLANLTFQEALVVLGPAYNFNVSRDGLLTFANGSQWQVV